MFQFLHAMYCKVVNKVSENKPSKFLPERERYSRAVRLAITDGKFVL